MQQDRQCAYNVTSRHVHKTTLAVEKQQVLHIGLCVHACACVRACMWVPGRVGVCMPISAYSLANPARNAYAPYCDIIWGPSVSNFLEHSVSYKGAHLPRPRLAEWLRWRPIFLSTHNGTCFMSPFCRLEFSGGSYIFGKHLWTPDLIQVFHWCSNGEVLRVTAILAKFLHTARNSSQSPCSSWTHFKAASSSQTSKQTRRNNPKMYSLPGLRYPSPGYRNRTDARMT